MKDILNNSEIARLVGYRGGRQLNEAGEQTLTSPRAPGVFGDLSASGKSNMPDRVTNNSGDNGMVDPMVGEDAGMPKLSNSMLDSLHAMLTKIGVDDSDIALNAVMLKPSGCSKVAKALTGTTMDESMAVEFFKDAIQALSRKLVGTKEVAQEGELNEFMDMPEDSRFTYVTDAMGDITVNDSQTGKSVHLRGSEAVELTGELQMHGGTADAEQKILSQYEHVMEEGMEAEVDEDVKMSQFFGATAGMDNMLQSLDGDIKNMHAKLSKMKQLAIDSHDMNGKFAAETFIHEVEALAHALSDYITKMNDE